MGRQFPEMVAGFSAMTNEERLRFASSVAVNMESLLQQIKDDADERNREVIALRMLQQVVSEVEFKLAAQRLVRRIQDRSRAS